MTWRLSLKVTPKWFRGTGNNVGGMEESDGDVITVGDVDIVANRRWPWPQGAKTDVTRNRPMWRVTLTVKPKKNFPQEQQKSTLFLGRAVEFSIGKKIYKVVRWWLYVRGCGGQINVQRRCRIILVEHDCVELKGLGRKKNRIKNCYTKVCKTILVFLTEPYRTCD